MMGKAQRRQAYERGVRSEERAAAFLVARGYEILAQRYKTAFGEVDLVARLDDMLVFVEVKARANYAEGVEAVRYRARRRIEQAALHFVSEHVGYADYGMRFDVIVVSRAGELGKASGGNSGNNSGGVSVDHLDNAWQAGQ